MKQAKLDPNKRYVLIPGWVISQSDGEFHYITASKLAYLYNISLQEPNVTVLSDTPRHVRGFRRQDNDIYLRPRKDGDYSLPD